jgi:enoyl-CoA hydratase
MATSPPVASLDQFECKMSVQQPYLAKLSCRSQFLHSEFVNRLGLGRLEISFSAVCEQMSEITTPDTDLLYEIRDGIGRITFNRPQARNSLTFNMYQRLAEICASAGKDRALKVLVLTGAGDKAFASGTDINQFRAFKTPQDAIDYEAGIDRVLSALEQCQVPTIAAINGVCAGGGAGIAACCDLRIGTGTAKFGFPIARTLGNCLSMSSIGRFATLIGAARLKELIFTARLIEAEEAVSLGLLNEMVGDLPALERRADELARLVAGHAPLTLRATKQALLRMQPKVREDEDLILMCYQSRDFREGMDAFLNKRPPQWTGA